MRKLIFVAATVLFQQHFLMLQAAKVFLKPHEANRIFFFAHAMQHIASRRRMFQVVRRL